jgi:circadian clock protein KaiB
VDTPAPLPPGADRRAAFERLAADVGRSRYHLRLFVAGLTPRSTRAVAVVRAVCDEYLGGRHDLEVVDVYQRPEVAKADQILAVPTLLRLLPPPHRKLIGDLADKMRLVRSLDIRANPRPTLPEEAT